MWRAPFFNSLEPADGKSRRWDPPARTLIAGLIGFAIIYYSLYFRCGFNLSDEGSVALLSKRLLDGEQPFKDLILGYNVLWFWPITFLFSVFGVNLVVMKIYFFYLAIITAALGFEIVRKITGCKWFALAVGVVLVVMPGTTYRTYLPLLAVANTYCLVRVALCPIRTKAGWLNAALGGLVLGLSFLIRVEIGFFCLILWLGVILVRSVGRGHPGYRATWGAGSVALVILNAMLVHLPVYRAAKAGGYETSFVDQYTVQLASTLHLPTWKRTQNRRKTPKVWAEKGTTGILKVSKIDNAIMARKPVADLWQQKRLRKKAFVFLIYAPVVSLGLLAVLLLGKSAMLIGAGRPERLRQLATGLIPIAGALTVFPQYFFFRPDLGHLSEFMPGCLVALGCGIYLAINDWKTMKARWVAGAIAAFGLIHGVVYIAHALPEKYAGTIAARSGRSHLFHGENGVDVYLSMPELIHYNELMKGVQDWAKPGEYVVCYPYLPGINFMTDRPTFERSLYVDNSTRSVKWEQQAIERFQTKKPAVIVTDEWSINRSEGSRFSNWAPEIQKFLDTQYHRRGVHNRLKVYSRDADQP